MSKAKFDWKPFLACLQQPKPSLSFLALMASLKAQGCSQHYIYDIFYSFLDYCIKEGMEDNQPELLDQLRDSMDAIVGWCSKSNWLFPEKPYYNPNPKLGMTSKELAEQFHGEPDAIGIGGKFVLYGLREFHLNEDKLDLIYHRGKEEGSWEPVGLVIKEFSV